MNADQEFGERFWGIRRARRDGDAAYLRALLTDPEHRARAAEALGALNDVESEPQIVRLLGASDLNTRCAAAKALGELPARASVNTLIETARTDELPVRTWATEALGKIGGPEALAALRTFLADDERRIRELAATGLERNSDIGSIDAIRAAADDRSRSEAWSLRRIARKIERQSRDTTPCD